MERTNTLKTLTIAIAALLAVLLAATPAGAQDVDLDPDKDGLTTEEELELGTDPEQYDTDVDRLSDGFEVRELGTDPIRGDSDEDGLGDGDELEVYKTDPLDADTDEDGVDDPTEIDAGTDPTDPARFPEVEEPAAAPTQEPVTALPNTGADADATDADDDNWPGVSIVLAIAALSLLTVGRRSGSLAERSRE